MSYYDIEQQPIEKLFDLEQKGSTFINELKRLNIGAGNNVFRIDDSGSYWGATTFSAAPASVSYTGIVTATGIILKGDSNVYCSFYSGSTEKGSISTNVSGWLTVLAKDNSIMLSGNNTNVCEISSTGALPATNDTFDLGTSAKRWRNMYLSGSLAVTTGVTTATVSCTTVNATNVNATCSGTIIANGGQNNGSNFLTAIQDFASGGFLTNVQYKQRSVQFTYGICTTFGGESGWLDA